MTYEDAENPWFALLDLTQPCAIWAGGTNGDGYGVGWRDGHAVGAHRLAWAKEHGPIPQGHVVDHHCHNADPTCTAGKGCPHRACVNVRHLVMWRGSAGNTRAAWRRLPACKRGHPWTDDNTRRRKNGRRECRACIRLRRDTDEYRAQNRVHAKRYYYKTAATVAALTA